MALVTSERAPAEPVQVGRVSRLLRYPVKSMAAEQVQAVDVSWHGVAGDRRWAFVRPDSETSAFPWHTIRENPSMCLFQAQLRDPDRPDASGVDVRTPEGDVLAVTDPALAARLGEGVRVMRLKRGLFDSLPLSLITTTTVGRLCARAGVVADPLRFRPNLLVEPTAEAAFVEDEWVSSTVSVGEVSLRVDRRDPRCVIVNVDPGSAARNPDVLKAVGADHGACAGVYASVERPGLVRVGDPVSVRSVPADSRC